MSGSSSSLRTLFSGLPLALVLGALVFYAWTASRGIPQGKLRDMPSAYTHAPERNLIRLEKVNRINLPDSSLTLTGSGNVLYAALRESGFVSIDVSNPESPQIVAHLENGSSDDEESVYVLNVTPIGEDLVVLDRVRGICSYEASDPFRPTFEWAHLLPGGPGSQAIDVQRAGDHLYFACGGGGLVQFPVDMTPDASPRQLLPRYDHTTDAALLMDDWILATDGRATGFQIVDAADGAEPTVVGNVSCWPLYLEHIAMIGNHAFMSTRGDNAMLVFNLNNPGNPYVSNVFRRRISAIKSITTWKERYVLLGNRLGFVEVFDAIDPETPRLIALLKIPGTINALYVKDDILFASVFGRKRIEVFRMTEGDDLDAPAAPRDEADFRWSNAES